MECAVSQDGRPFCQYMMLAEMQPLGLEKRALAGVVVGVWRGLVGKSHSIIAPSYGWIRKQLNWQSQDGIQQDWELHGTRLCHLPVTHHMLPPFGFVLLSAWRETILRPDSCLGRSKSVCCPRSDALGELRLKAETNLGGVVAAACVLQNKDHCFFYSPPSSRDSHVLAIPLSLALH